MNHDPGPRTTQSASRTASTAWGQACGHAGSRLTETISPSVVATATWPRTVLWASGCVGVETPDDGRDVHGRERHRQHPAGRAEEAGHPVERLDVVAEELPQADDEQVADHVAAHLALAGEAVLHDPLPGAAPVVVAAEGGERHPEVAGRQHAELAPQPAGRAAVVGDGDDGRRVRDDVPQRGQRGVEPVAAAEGDHGELTETRPGHSRPRSRWVARTWWPRSPRRRATSSVIATLRCLPPVQPMAMVMNRLPSAR